MGRLGYVVRGTGGCPCLHLRSLSYMQYEVSLAKETRDRVTSNQVVCYKLSG